MSINRYVVQTTALVLCLTALACSTGDTTMPQGIFPRSYAVPPPPDARAALVPPGYRVEVFMKDLHHPTSIELDDAGNVYVAEAGYNYGDPVAEARIFQVSPSGAVTLYARGFNGPLNDLLWHDGRLYVSHAGEISRVEPDGSVQDLVTGLPSFGDHHNNALTAGPDGKIYFGMGTVTNSGVVSLDNTYPFAWMLWWPDLRDIPARDIQLTGEDFTTTHPNNVLARQGSLVTFWSNFRAIIASVFSRDPSSSLLVTTGAFQPFGVNDSDAVRGQVKSNGTILRMNPDGSGLEVYAWGLRNPFGVGWSPDGRLIASDNAYDERGARPIANAEDNIWVVREGAWYGWPDYSSGIPVTDPRFRSERGFEPEFLMENHPPVEKPLMTRPKHAAVTKFDFSRGGDFGPAGTMYLAEIGGSPPISTSDTVVTGHVVNRIDLASGRIEPFFRADPAYLGAAGPDRYVVTPAPKRPVDVRFSPDGRTLYIVDIGALAVYLAGAGPFPRPYPGSGVVWRITREPAGAVTPPADRTPLPPSTHASR